jgi:hypothetical protein
MLSSQHTTMKEVAMTDSFESSSSLPPEVLEHYASGSESQRLLHGASQIELVRACSRCLTEQAGKAIGTETSLLSQGSKREILTEMSLDEVHHTTHLLLLLASLGNAPVAHNNTSSPLYRDLIKAMR